MDAFLTILSKENWNSVYQAAIDNKYNVFLAIFCYAFETGFPKLMITGKIRSANGWISEDVRDTKRKIVDLEKLYRESKSENLKLRIKQLKKDVTAQCNREKKMFFDKKILNSKNKSRSTWKVIKSETKNSSNTKTNNIILKSENKIVSDPILVGDIFNKFFTNVVDDFIKPNLHLDTSIPSENSGQAHIQISNAFKFTTIDEKYLYSLIMSFENKNSTGVDEIPITVVKNSINLILKPLTHIINSSLISGYFPSKMKIAKIIPIFKKGSPNDPSSYRPVSLLPVFSKILQKVVYNQLLTFLESNRLLDDEQHGFRSKKSTITAGIKFIESIIDSIDRKNNIIGIFLDLAKAFDSVPHDKLIDQLCALNIKGKELNWFTSYLQNRVQCVEIRNCTRNQNSRYEYIHNFHSGYRSVKYGVPQGSILGPLLFICYITGLPSVIPSGCGSVCLYADDTNLVVSGQRQEEIELASFISLLSVKHFLDTKHLLLNTNKSNFIAFSTKQNKQKMQPKIYIDESKINQTEDCKFLGIILDQNLSWDKHVNHVVCKMSSGLYALRHMSRVCNIDTLKSIYFSLINSYMAYGIVIYGATSKKNLNRILLQQKKALRIIFNLKQRQAVKEYFSKLGILTVYALYIFECILYVKTNEVKTTIINRHHNTRLNRYVEPHNLKFFEKKASFMGSKFLFSLPKYILNETCFKTFKNKLKNYLLNSPLYSFEDFWSLNSS
jgi:hypothetical protein